MGKKLGTVNPARRRFLKQTLGALALGAGVVGFEQRDDADDLVLTERDVPLAGWPASASGLRVGQLSDFHCDCAHAVARVHRAVAMMLAQKPDVVFLTGDYLTEKPRRWAAPAVAALAPLTQVPGGVFAVLGNHDYWSGGPEVMTRGLSHVGITVLRNLSVPLPGGHGVWLVGLDDRCVRRQNAALALEGVPPDAAKLLLIHEPDFADEAPPGFALQLSGHSHAGQIRVPGLPPMHCPKYGRQYPEGLQRAKNHWVYTSRGVGLVGPQMRLFCPPEVTVLRLLSAPV